MAFPSPPWHLRGDAWGSVVRATAPGDPAPATWVLGLVSYAPGSTLAYSELLVARLRDPLRGEVTVRDMWVDSEPSREAGRSLWALPKQPAAFDHDPGGLGPVGRHEWTVSLDGSPALRAEVLDLPGAAVPTPVRGSTAQERSDGRTVRASFHGRARVLPCLARWDVAADGPLAWLRGRAPLASFRVRDFRVTFG